MHQLTTKEISVTAIARLKGSPAKLVSRGAVIAVIVPVESKAEAEAVILRLSKKKGGGDV